MAIYKMAAELRNFIELADGTMVDLIKLTTGYYATEIPADWKAPKTAPAIGTVAYVDAMGRARRGVVVKTTPTKVHVAITSQAAIDRPTPKGIRVQVVVADTNYVRVAPPAEPVAETLDAIDKAAILAKPIDSLMNSEVRENETLDTTSELAQNLVAADHEQALVEDAERESFSQNYAWVQRHDLPSGRREHIDAAITADHEQALTEDAERHQETAEPVTPSPVREGEHLVEIDEAHRIPVREVTGSAVVKLLERVHERIRQNHPEVPAMVIVTGAGTQAGSNKWGHFRPNGWTTSEKSAIHEMFMAGETLAKGAKQVLQTMLHESAHALAEVRGKQDTSRQGRWHNKVFLETAREVGLEHKSDKADKAHGYSFVTLTTDTLAEYQDLLDELDQEIHLMVKLPFWLGSDKDGEEGGGDGMGRAPRGEGGSSNGGNLKLTCLCDKPNIIRASKKVADLQVVNCGDCDALFLERS